MVLCTSGIPDVIGCVGKDDLELLFQKYLQQITFSSFLVQQYLVSYLLDLILVLSEHYSASFLSFFLETLHLQRKNKNFRFFKINLSISLPKVQLFEIDPSSTSSELTESVDMITSLFAGPGEPDKRQILALVRNRFFRVFVLKKHDLPQGKSVAGVVMISSFGFKNVVHLEYTVISDLLQGKGLGILIMQSLISLLKVENYGQDKAPKYMTLECEEKLMNFYSKTSFKDSELSPLPCHSEINGKKSIILYKWMEAQLSEENVFVARNVMEQYREQLIGRLLFVRSLMNQARIKLIQNK